MYMRSSTAQYGSHARKPKKAFSGKVSLSTIGGKVKPLTITEARKNLPSLVRNAAAGNDLATIGVKGKDQVVLLSYARYKALENKLAASVDMRQQIAEGIAKRLLRDAPSHLVVPQVRELAALTLGELAVLLPLERLPLKPEERSRVVGRLKKNGVVLDRLERRYAIAQAIATAAGEGLYEALEHRTSGLGIWANESDETKGETDRGFSGAEEADDAGEPSGRR